MKKEGLSKITIASLLASVFATANAGAAPDLQVNYLGSAAKIRSQVSGQGQSASAPMQFAEKEGGEGKCGEGKCGEGDKDKDGGEGKCGEGDKDKDGGEGKCGEGKCGDKS